MKTCITLLLLLQVSMLYSQKQLTFPLLKENHEVDSIMNIVINNSYSKEICFSFTTIHSPVGYYFSILRLAKKQPDLYYYALQPTDIKAYGYFKINDYNVFVYGDDEPSAFFKKTSVKTTFKFISLGGKTIFWSMPDTSDDPEHRIGKFLFGSSDIKDKILPIKHKR